jgi:hypothetical protein
MEHQDTVAFISLLSAYKRLWIKCRVAQSMARNPSADRETVESFLEEAATEGFEPAFEALHSEQGVQAALRVALETFPPEDHQE